MKIVAIVLFIAMYVGLIALPKRKTIIALAVAVIFMVLGILPVKEAFWVVDWNVLLKSYRGQAS